MTAWEFAGPGSSAMMRTYLGCKWLVILPVGGRRGRIGDGWRACSRVRAEPLLSPVRRERPAPVGARLRDQLADGHRRVASLALGALGLTHIVMSILGVASILGLAVGFAFRDITENFIASVLLGVRRPFQIGDYIHGRRPLGRGQAAQYLGDCARHPGRQSRPDPECDRLQGDHGQLDGVAQLAEQLRRPDPARGVPQRRDRGGQQGPGRSAGDPPRAAASARIESLGVVRRPRPGLLLVAGPGRRLAPASAS